MRKIYGQVFTAKDEPWSGAILRFKLSPGTSTANIIYPAQEINVKCDSLGKFEENFFTNTEGEIPCHYTCKLPDGEEFKFDLPPGNTPIELSVLQQLSVTPGEPKYQTFLEYLDNHLSVEPAILRSIPLVAAQNLSALRVVSLSNSGLIYADPSNLNTAFTMVGVTDTSVSLGETTRILTYGTLQDNSWNWQVNVPLFLGSNGQITQMPNITGYLVQLGTALSSNMIFIDKKNIFIL